MVSNTNNVLRPVIRVTSFMGGEEVIDLYNDFRYLTLSIKSLDKRDMEMVEAK